MSVASDVDDGVDRSLELAFTIGGQGGSKFGQQRLARPPPNEDAVAEAEPGLVGLIEALELGGEARPIGVGLPSGCLTVITLFDMAQGRHRPGRRTKPRVGVDELDLIRLGHLVSDGAGLLEQLVDAGEGPGVGEAGEKRGRALEEWGDGSFKLGRTKVVQHSKALDRLPTVHEPR